METWLAIAAGGALGALLRGALLRAFSPRAPQSSPAEATPAWREPAVGILIANVLGCLFAGLWLGSDAGARAESLPWIEWALLTGLAGGLTTFSTLCSDALRLHRNESWVWVCAYLSATVFLGLASFHWASGGFS